MLSLVLNHLNFEKVIADATKQIESSVLPEASPFKLPIEYLEEQDIHKVSDIVQENLELTATKSDSSTPLFHILVNPTNSFSQHVAKQHSVMFTSNQGYLKDTQQVIKNAMDHPTNNEKISSSDADKYTSMWATLKKDTRFVEKYGFMEWNILKGLNTSTMFHQTMSFVNIFSPITSVLVPIIMLIIPFFMMKMKGLTLTMTTYMDLLKTVAKNHAIGKALKSLNEATLSGVFYFLISIGFYLLQIYQNVVNFIKYHRNIKMIYEHINQFRVTIESSLIKMQNFVYHNGNLPYYSEFCKTTEKHMNVLMQLMSDLEPVCTFGYNVKAFFGIGHLMKCYYLMHSNEDYDLAMKYMADFEGYHDNITSIADQVHSGKLSFCQFVEDKPTCIKRQLYPTCDQSSEEEDDDEDTVGKGIRNDCDLSNNLIITGINASGKTTTLKTTALNILFSQQFGCGYYDSETEIRPYTHIHCYMNIPDTSARDSLFQAESRRCKEIIDIINAPENESSRHFCIFDELYSGTNPVDATKSAYAFLRYISGYKNVDFILTTHYTNLCKKIKDEDRMVNKQMDVERNEDGSFFFKYKLIDGICEIQGAIEILKEMQYPETIIKMIEEYDE